MMIESVIKLHRLLKSLDSEADLSVFEEKMMHILQEEIAYRIEPYRSPFIDIDETFHSYDEYQEKIRYVDKLYDLYQVLRKLKNVDLSPILDDQDAYVNHRYQLNTVEAIDHLLLTIENLPKSTVYTDIKGDPFNKLDPTIIYSRKDPKLIVQEIYLKGIEDKETALFDSLKNYWITEELLQEIIADAERKEANDRYLEEKRRYRKALTFTVILPMILVFVIFVALYLVAYRFATHITENINVRNFWNFLWIYLVLSIIHRLLVRFVPRIGNLIHQQLKAGFLVFVVISVLFAVMALFTQLTSSGYFGQYWIAYLIVSVATIIFGAFSNNLTRQDEVFGIHTPISQLIYTLFNLLFVFILLYIFHDNSVLFYVALSCYVVLNVGGLSII